VEDQSKDVKRSDVEEDDDDDDQEMEDQSYDADA
jgi:hypothetical protein